MGCTGTEVRTRSAAAGGVRFWLLRLACVACACLLIAAGLHGVARADDADEKTSVPTVTIEVAEEASDGTLTWGKQADAQVDTWVQYRVTGTLPSTYDSFESYYYSFTIELPDSLLLDESSVSVTLCGGV